MLRFYANEGHCFSRERRYFFLLIACWLIGLLIGYLFSKPFSSALMRSAVQQPVSIVGLCVTVFFPLCFAYFSFLSEKPIVLMIVSFIKAVAFSFSGALVWHYFQSAGWIICFFLMFSDCCFLVVFLILLLRYFSGVSLHLKTDFCISAFIAICIATADYFVISPFLQGLF